MFCYLQTKEKFINTIKSDGDKFLAYNDRGKIYFEKACFFKATKNDNQDYNKKEHSFSRRLLKGKRKCTPIDVDFWSGKYECSN
tara:strand:- start:108 stop:359 length:252 start_codon:yes stop_codon:yes gene_type:complete